MKKNIILKIILTFTCLNSFVFAGPAITGTRTFAQPDGTKFEGVLKGDSSFHWIESNGKVVIYNPEDKFYYEAIIDTTNGLILSATKPQVKSSNLLQAKSLKPIEHKVSSDDKNKLFILYKKSKTGHHPE